MADALSHSCPTCGGSGYGGDGGHEYNTQEEYEGIHEHVCRICPVPCPDCIDGYPNDLKVRAAVDAALAAVEEGEE